MKEIWKDIENFEGLYQVSNLGNDRSLDRIKNQFNGYYYSNRIYKGKILKPAISKNGYLRVLLQANGIKKNCCIHRLVAETFIPNIDNLPIINHKDENKLNNQVDNLEWCTQSYNINYGNRNKKVINKLKGKPKSEEHRLKLSMSAKKRIIGRDEKGRFLSRNDNSEKIIV